MSTHKYYGMTDLQGHGERLDIKKYIVNPLEVVPLCRNESVVSSDETFDVHLRYWNKLQEAHDKFALFMKNVYNYPAILAPKTSHLVHSEPEVFLEGKITLPTSKFANGAMRVPSKVKAVAKTLAAKKKASKK